MNAKSPASLDELLKKSSCFITYVPLRSEVDFHTLLRDTVGEAYQIAPRASLDPEVEATAAIAAVRERTACILLPGRAFDALGTRHGQGGGWYDQFLALVPSDWIRIGFCHASQFSETTLVKNSWDQPVDCVVVVNETNKTYRLYVTNARTSATMPS